MAGTGWLVAAAAIKLTPLFFIHLGGDSGEAAACWPEFLASAACAVVLPILQRGLTQGLLDLTTYYDSFIQQFASGFVVTNYRNQNLAAMVYRAVVPRASGNFVGLLTTPTSLPCNRRRP